jgi:hypothetical protein
MLQTSWNKHHRKRRILLIFRLAFQTHNRAFHAISAGVAYNIVVKLVSLRALAFHILVNTVFINHSQLANSRLCCRINWNTLAERI